MSLFSGLENFGDRVKDIHIDTVHLEDTDVSRIGDVKVSDTTTYTFEEDKEVKKYPIIPVTISTTEKGTKYIEVMLWGSVREMLDYLELLNVLEVAEDGDEMTIYIDSPGGSIVIACMIASAMIRSKAKVHCVGVGKVASCAMFIWSAGDSQEVLDSAAFMFHMSTHGGYDTSTNIRDKAIRLIDFVVEYLLGISVDKGHLLIEELDRILDKNENIWIDGPTMRSRIGGSDVE
jgi:ATP-dependent protease ClpP protease subunit